MRRIAVINQKGGVGKTTTTVNVGSALARAGHRVLMIDLDPQAHMTLHLGMDPTARRPGIYEMLTGSSTIAKARVRVGNNLWAIGASIDLAAAEVELVSVVGREVILRDLLDQHVGVGLLDNSSNGKARTPQYDYVLMDCPPSLSVLTLNGLCAAQEVIIPLQPHYLALQGLGKLLETISLVGKRINPSLTVAGVVICMHDAGTKLAGEVIEDARSFFDSARGANVPWGSARVFGTAIRRNIKLAESPSYGKSIFDYAPDSNGAKDYATLAIEIHDPASLPSPVREKKNTDADDATLTKQDGKPSTEESVTPGYVGRQSSKAKKSPTRSSRDGKKSKANAKKTHRSVRSGKAIASDISKPAPKPNSPTPKTRSRQRARSTGTTELSREDNSYVSSVSKPMRLVESSLSTEESASSEESASAMESGLETSGPSVSTGDKTAAASGMG